MLAIGCEWRGLKRQAGQRASLREAILSLLIENFPVDQKSLMRTAIYSLSA